MGLDSESIYKQQKAERERREKFLERESGKFAWKDELTAADICLTPQFLNAHRFGAPVEDFPLCQAVAERCKTLESYRASSPEAWKI